jgi:hypothetical protein
MYRHKVSVVSADENKRSLNGEGSPGEPEAALQTLPGAVHGAAESEGSLRVRPGPYEAWHRERLLPLLRPVYALPLHERRRGRFRAESLQVSTDPAFPRGLSSREPSNP